MKELKQQYTWCFNRFIRPILEADIIGSAMVQDWVRVTELGKELEKHKNE